MIEVFARRRQDRCTFFATGHAETGGERDVVCAGVSALAGALVLHAVKSSAQYLRYNMSPGQIFLSCRGLGEALDMTLTGLAAIAAKYPAHLRISIDGDDALSATGGISAMQTVTAGAITKKEEML